jgi:hypothetical protein
LNVIGRTPPRRLTLFAGAGAVLHRKQVREYRSVINFTPPSSPSGPPSGACADGDERSVTRNGGLQVLTGTDVSVTRRSQLFAALRYEMRPDLAMGSVGVVAGARIGLY